MLLVVNFGFASSSNQLVQVQLSAEKVFNMPYDRPVCRAFDKVSKVIYTVSASVILSSFLFGKL